MNAGAPPNGSSASAASGSTLIPSLRYRDAHAAVEWLERTLGFTRHAVYTGPDDTIAHAELRHGRGMVMLGSTANPSPHNRWYTTPEDTNGRVTSPLYLVVADCTRLWGSVQAAGVEVVAELQEMSYGGSSFTVRDPEGYLWSVGEYDPWSAHEAGVTG